MRKVDIKNQCVKTKKVVCSMCNLSFFKKPNDNIKYCSNKCLHKSKQTKILVKCVVCKKEFYKYPFSLGWCKNQNRQRIVLIKLTHNKCTVCNASRGEREVARILEKLNIKYEKEYKFDDCETKKINILPFDFLIYSNQKIKMIEYHGAQHYKLCDFGRENICKKRALKKTRRNDKIKRDFCKSKKIPFLEISYKNYNKIEELITNFIEM